MTMNDMCLALTRGDTAFITISAANSAGEHRPFVNGDTVRFTVKRDVNAVDSVIQKVFTDFELDGTILLTITPDDTKGLHYRDYVYDVELTTNDGIVITIVKPSKFTVLPEVTF